MEFEEVCFASLSLDSLSCADIVCGSNGLPLTPNSIKIIGEFRAQVEHIEHPNLIKYVDCFRDKRECVTLVFEHLPFQQPPALDYLKVLKQLLDALHYLHNTIQCVHGLLTHESFVWSANDLKLAHWPINLLTEGGQTVGSHSIVANSVRYTAPELVKRPRQKSTRQTDIWSAGLVLLSLIKPSLKLPENPSWLITHNNASDLIKEINGFLEDDQIANAASWNALFAKILTPDPNCRATLEELYNIMGLQTPLSRNLIGLEKPLDPDEYKKIVPKLFKFNVAEIYHVWRLSYGRNYESEHKKEDCPPIFRVPLLITAERAQNADTGAPNLKSYIIIDTNPEQISLAKFRADVARLDAKIFYPLILTDPETPPSRRPVVSPALSNGGDGSAYPTKACDGFTFADFDKISIRSDIQTKISTNPRFLPIIIKEADFAYQCERISLFKRLVAGCPYLTDQLRRESALDIPPLKRAETWAILLGINSDDSRELYATIGKSVAAVTERQISVDIPRCHQYNELMASPQGHLRLARILKAWLNHNASEYVYWQGLDSLAAPFLLINFHDEAMAFACFNAFVQRYMRGFFKKDNQPEIQRYLDMFSDLLSYHDSDLALHLERLGFLPNLYAIPWFLTMFTHALPLHKILHLWDALLLGDERFPLCIGMAILKQLRKDLMFLSFNDCITAFSDLPELDLERCIADALHFYSTTPDKLVKLNRLRGDVDSKDLEVS